MQMLGLYESTKNEAGGIVVAKKKTKTRKLTKRQQTTLKRHSKHHTRKHMAFMRREMRKGKSFTAAHRAAKRKVGR